MTTGLAFLLKAAEPDSTNQGLKGTQTISSKEGEPISLICEHAGIIKIVPKVGM